jgi:arylsulfatase
MNHTNRVATVAELPRVATIGDRYTVAEDGLAYTFDGATWSCEANQPSPGGEPDQPLPGSDDATPGQGLPAGGTDAPDQSLPGDQAGSEQSRQAAALLALGRSNRKRPNVVYFHVDNLGFGELGCYGGGLLRGAETKRIDAFAEQGFKLLNFAPEAQCTPSRTALLTGRYAIRTGNHTVSGSDSEGGIVAWEKTLGDVFSAAGYATMCLGKWHIGDAPGRWPCDHGFDTWYGPPHSYDECLWELDPWYRPGRDPEAYMLEQQRDRRPRNAGKLTYELKRTVDTDYLRRAREFIRDNAGGLRSQPFFLYYNPTLMHLPNVPRDEYKGKSGNGPWADCLLQLDGDFGVLLDALERQGIAEDTIVVLAGDNGNEEALLHRGSSGFWEGSYFTGQEASLRTPCLIRYPGEVKAGGVSNDIMHITDMYTTLLSMANIKVPADRVIDGLDQTAWLSGRQERSARDGFLFWNGPALYGAKWRDFKLALVKQKTMFDPALQLSFPHVINLMTDPKEREPINALYMHTWTLAHFGRLMGEFVASIEREPMIPAGAPLDFVPNARDPRQRENSKVVVGAMAKLIPSNWSG